MEDIKLIKGDCLVEMQNIPDKSIDCIICDLPYGTTACKWDTIIPFDKLWEQYNRIIKDNGAICLFGSEPFSSMLRMSNLKMYKYDWYWVKSKPNGFQHANNKPMKTVETISVFSKSPMGHKSLLGDKRMVYNPQGIKENGMKKVKESSHRGNTMGGDGNKSSRPNQVGREYMSYTNYPFDVLYYNNITGSNCIHPTQKPTALIEYLIKTYSNEGDTILDNTAGSMTTAIAAINTNRKCICIEKDDKYFEIGSERVRKHLENKQLKLF